MQILDPKHPFFKPAWRRWLTVILPAAWGLVEISNNAIGWAVVFFAAAGYAAYELLIMYDRRIAEDSSKSESAIEEDKRAED